MNVGTLIAQLTDSFGRFTIDAPQLTAEILVSEILECPRLELVGQPLINVSAAHQKRILALSERICTHEPLQYVLASTNFIGHELFTDKRALIPRPETEQLVEHVLACEALWDRTAPSLIDVGTGSGCIIISLALARREASCFAVDASPEALELAKKNAARHGLADRITWRQHDLLAGFAECSLDGIVANLPYISSAECLTLPQNVRDYEPVTALDGGEDGLDLISRLVLQGSKTLNSTGWLFMEIGEEQGHAVEIMLEKTGYQQICIKKDLAGRDRFAIASIS